MSSVLLQMAGALFCSLPGLFILIISGTANIGVGIGVGVGIVVGIRVARGVSVSIKIGDNTPFRD